MSSNIFLYVFLALSLIDLYFNRIQKTSQMLCTVGNLPPEMGGYFNPKFIRFAFPLTLIKWLWILYWAFSFTMKDAFLAYFIFLAVSFFIPPIPLITIPPIRRQVNIVKSIDPELGDLLLDPVNRLGFFKTKKHH